MFGTIKVNVKMLDGSGGETTLSSLDPANKISRALGYDQTMYFPYTMLHNGKILDPYLTLQSQNVRDGDTIVLSPENIEFDESQSEEDSAEARKQKAKNQIENIFAEILRMNDVANSTKTLHKKNRNLIETEIPEPPKTDQPVYPTVIAGKSDSISTTELPMMWETSQDSPTQSPDDDEEFNPKKYVDYLFSTRL